jgi:hypothetical protein
VPEVPGVPGAPELEQGVPELEQDADASAVDAEASTDEDTITETETTSTVDDIEKDPNWEPGGARRGGGRGRGARGARRGRRGDIDYTSVSVPPFPFLSFSIRLVSRVPLSYNRLIPSYNALGPWGFDAAIVRTRDGDPPRVPFSVGVPLLSPVCFPLYNPFAHITQSCSSSSSVSTSCGATVLHSRPLIASSLMSCTPPSRASLR